MSWWRRRGLWVAVFSILLLLGIHFGYRNAPLLADWYASFAAENLPPPASSFAPTETPTGAYFYCARQVVRRINGASSVETFPSPQDLVSLGGGRYRIASYVDEMRQDGSRVRYEFVCSVLYQRGRWVLEQLDLSERFVVGSGERPALARRD